MHDAYESVPILEKLPLQIDCLAAWGESALESFTSPLPLMFSYHEGARVFMSSDYLI